MKVLLIGAGLGFGLALYRRLLKDGHEVVGLTHHEENPKEGLKYFKIDPTNSLSICTSAKEALLYKCQWMPEVVICNAGKTVIAPSHTQGTDILKDVMGINYFFPAELARQWLEMVMAHNVNTDGRCDTMRFIVTGSYGIKQALRNSPAYCASKSAIEAHMRVLAREYAGVLPVMFATVSPGGVQDTSMADQAVKSLMDIRGFTEEEARRYNAQSPFGRNMTHEEVVEMFMMTLSAPIYLSGMHLIGEGGNGAR